MYIAGRAITIAVLLAALSVGVPVSPGHSAALASDATITVQIGPTTRAISASFGSLTPDWLTPQFDTSFWRPVQRVKAEIEHCVVQNTEDWQGIPMYWARDVQHSAYFRQAFTVPEADSYAESTLILGRFTNEYAPAPTSAIYINQQEDVSGYNEGILQLAIGSYLHAGVNILGFYGPSATVNSPSGIPCSAFGFRLIIHAHGLHGASGHTGSTAVAVAVLRPANGATVTGSTVPFAWSPLSRAAAYLFHIWLTKADPGQAITSNTVATASLTVTEPTASIPTANMPKGLYTWSVAAIDAKGQTIANWSGPRTVQIE